MCRVGTQPSTHLHKTQRLYIGERVCVLVTKLFLVVKVFARGLSTCSGPECKTHSNGPTAVSRGHEGKVREDGVFSQPSHRL